MMTDAGLRQLFLLWGGCLCLSVLLGGLLLPRRRRGIGLDDMYLRGPFWGSWSSRSAWSDGETLVSSGAA